MDEHEQKMPAQEAPREEARPLRYKDLWLNPPAGAQEAPPETCDVALKDCPRCHGDGYWYDWKVDEEQTIPQATSATLTYQPFCNCAEEIRLAKKPATSDPLPAEPEAGAQVPSQDEREIYKIVGQMSANGTRATALYIMKLESSLQRIRDYAREAAKTPITREDMHDPLKAQTFYDETKGFYNIILSEINRGPLSSRPITCDPGTIFYATDTKETFVCMELNTWTRRT
jgi:hypothetical protein